MTDATVPVAPNPADGPAQRRFIRIPMVLPVDFQLSTPSEGALHADPRTAVTRDLSEDGLCLDVTALPERVATRLEADDLSNLEAIIDLDIGKRRVRIHGRIAWTTTMTTGDGKRYRVGVQFTRISGSDAAALVRFARQAALRPSLSKAVVLLAACIALVAAGLYSWTTARHRQEITLAQHQVETANARYEQVASELESITRDLMDVSRILRASADEVSAPSLAGDATGGIHATDLPPDVLSTAVDELRTELVVLKRRVSNLRSELERLRGTSKRHNHPSGPAKGRANAAPGVP